MKIAVIGSGIAGLSCAWHLSRKHAVTLYEADARLGGHSNTVDVTVDGIAHPVDTGFLVFNERTYPNLIELFRQLDVATTPTDMSFSARVALPLGRDLEWAGTNLDSVFAQRHNLLRPAFLRMLADILRFNRLATDIAGAQDEASRDTAPGPAPAAPTGRASLGEFLERNAFSAAFRDWYLLPMAAAIWSCPTRQMLEFPVASFVRFCHNHGLLQIADRPRWHTVVGGSREYVRKLVAGITEVRCNEPVLQVRRTGWNGLATVQAASGTVGFDQVVFACHGDQALALLADADAHERAILGAVRYQANRAVLHTDAGVLPRNRRAWAAWNYVSAPASADPAVRSVCVHYLINKLQPVPFTRPVLVSLNPADTLDPASVLAEFDYAHPVFDHAALAAQRRLHEIQGRRGTWFCGAWTGYGFHEDGLKSGLAVAAALSDLGQPLLAA